MTFTSFLKCTLCSGMCVIPAVQECSLMVAMATHLRLTKVICHLRWNMCVCCRGKGGVSHSSSVHNIDCPCNEFLVLPPPQFERLTDSCVYVYVYVYVPLLMENEWLQRTKSSSHQTAMFRTVRWEETGTFACLVLPRFLDLGVNIVYHLSDCLRVLAWMCATL